ncbi:MAG: hypothetical protein MJZ20_00205 [Bacteroidaceae bacterium]|nr:hypothetical protein [Bacteroidaceae bacterium]
MFASIDAFAVMSITLFLNRTKRLDTKKREIVLLSIPRAEALALPIIVEQTTSEATPYEDSLCYIAYIYDLCCTCIGTKIPL